jgi:hypothetical protein
MEREQEPLLKKLKLLVLFNPLMEWIDTTHLMRLYAHDKTLKQGMRANLHRWSYFALGLSMRSAN